MVSLRNDLTCWYPHVSRFQKHQNEESLKQLRFFSLLWFRPYMIHCMCSCHKWWCKNKSTVYNTHLWRNASNLYGYSERWWINNQLASSSNWGYYSFLRWVMTNSDIKVPAVYYELNAEKQTSWTRWIYLVWKRMMCLRGFFDKLVIGAIDYIVGYLKCRQNASYERGGGHWYERANRELSFFLWEEICVLNIMIWNLFTT